MRRYALLAAVAVFAALPAAAQTRTVTVAPDTLQLAVGDTARPRVEVRAGNSTPVTAAALTFSSSNAGVFTAHRDGSITARAPGCATWRVTHATYARAQVAVCVAAAPVPPVSSAPIVTVTAQPATVGAGGVVTVAWAAQGATSCSTTYAGAALALPAAGSETVTVGRDTTFRIACSGAGGTGAGQASVRVTAPPPPAPVDPTPPPAPVDTAPVPPPSSGFTANRPAGLTLVTDTYFGHLRPDQAYNADGLASAWDGRNATDPSAPFGPHVYETFYPGNHRSNGDGGSLLWGPEGQRWRQVYFALMQWVPANYSMHTNGEKFWHPLIAVNGTVTSSTMLGWHTPEWAGYPGGAGDSTWVFGLQTQIGDPNRFQARAAPRPVKGRWQHVEVHMAMNSPGQRDGILRVWVDGQLAIDWRDVRYSNQASQAHVYGIRFSGVRGGGVSAVPTPPEGQVRRYSRLAFYAAP